MMRIGLDLRGCSPGYKAHYGRGTGRYAQELVTAFGDKQQIVAKKQIELEHLTLQDLSPGPFLSLIEKCVPYGRRTLEDQFLLPGRLAHRGLDLIHFFSHGDAPARLSVPYVVTVLDLIPLKFPELYKPARMSWRFRLARFLELEVIRRASLILAISECTKRDIVELLGVSPEKIVVTYLAASKDFGPMVDRSREEAMRTSRVSLGLPSEGDLLTYVGGIDQRKNILFLLRVFKELLRDSRPLYLVMVGRYEQDKHYPELLSTIKELGLEERVLLLGYVSDEKLPLAYHASALTLFPSLYEGFGLPVLESLACGVPVLAGNNSSIPEVAGSDEFLVPDNCVTEWVNRIGQLLSDSEYLRSLGIRGIEQAKKFSWENAALQTLAAYEAALAQMKKTI